MGRPLVCHDGVTIAKEFSLTTRTWAQLLPLARASNEPSVAELLDVDREYRTTGA